MAILDVKKIDFTGRAPVDEEKRIAAAIFALECRVDVTCHMGVPRKEHLASEPYHDFELRIPAVATTYSSQMGTMRKAVLVGEVRFHITNNGGWERSDPPTHEDEGRAVLITTGADGRLWAAYEGPQIQEELNKLVLDHIARRAILQNEVLWSPIDVIGLKRRWLAQPPEEDREI